MIDVKPTNVKLQLRARRILREICGDRSPESDEELDSILQECGRSVKLAAVCIWLGVPVEEGKIRLTEANDILANIIKGPKNIKSFHKEDQKFVLCVDGGGSKCKAVIVSQRGAIGSGEAGPCNP